MKRVKIIEESIRGDSFFQRQQAHLQWRSILSFGTACLLGWGGIVSAAGDTAAATQPSASVVAASHQPSWSAPVTGELRVLHDFEKPAQRWSPGHRGVDIASHDGTVRAPAGGKVVFSGKVVDRTVITVEHADGMYSTFEPVKDPLPEGTPVRAGDLLATIDDSVKHCTQACLHWGVYTGKGKTKEYINPLLLLGLTGPSVLLPIGEDFSA